MLVGSVTKPEEIEKIGPLVDLVELRLDHFDIHKKPKYPCIFTLRKKAQGGVLEIGEKERLAKIEKYLELKPDYVDIEADTDPSFIEKIAKKTKLIGSYHNFEETPHDLDAVLQSMKNPHFAIYKIAVKANSTPDMLRLMLFTRKSKVSAMAMGEFGKPSRVLAKIMGSELDYTGLADEPSLHRYGISTLLETFHYRKLTKNTLIYALIGDPVEKSPGDIFHNPRFKHDAVYVKMIVRPHEVHETFSLMKKLPFGGLSVTIPLKELVQPEMNEITQIAQDIGAINTVTFKHGNLIGTNTDAPGALNALEKHIRVKGKTVAVLGAGGSSKAIVYEAKQRGAHVLIFNRTQRPGLLGLNELPNHSYDILINTIPPTHTQTPHLRAGAVVMDIVISPRDTPILIAAKKLGCRCVYGEEMFTEQALLQQKEWAIN